MASNSNDQFPDVENVFKDLAQHEYAVIPDGWEFLGVYITN